MRRLPSLSLISFAILWSGCQKDRVEVYEVSKDSPSTMAVPMQNTAPAPMPASPPMAGQGNMMPGGGMSGGMPSGMIPETPQGSSSEIRWKTPKGWQEQPVSGMRIGSFLVTGSNGQQADVSIIPIGGEVGGDLANINRWRGQLNLGPISDGDIGSLEKKIDFNGKQMLYADLVSDEPLIGGKFKKRITAASYPFNGRTWFFKITGDDETVRTAEPAFKEFLRSIRFTTQ